MQAAVEPVDQPMQRVPVQMAAMQAREMPALELQVKHLPLHRSQERSMQAAVVVAVQN
jgi:hypothetical protein